VKLEFDQRLDQRAPERRFSEDLKVIRGHKSLEVPKNEAALAVNMCQLRIDRAKK
jgi:hypothetical protein